MKLIYYSDNMQLIMRFYFCKEQFDYVFVYNVDREFSSTLSRLEIVNVPDSVFFLMLS